MERAGARSLAFGPGSTHPSLCFSASVPGIKRVWAFDRSLLLMPCVALLSLGLCKDKAEGMSLDSERRV